MDNIVFVYTRLNGKHGFVLKMCSQTNVLYQLLANTSSVTAIREVRCLGRAERKIFFYTRNLTA